MIDSSFIYTLSIPVYIIFLIIHIKKKIKFSTIFLHTLFYFYIVMVIGVTLFPLPIEKATIEKGIEFSGLDMNNFIPFSFIKESIETLAYDPHTPYITFYDSLKVVLRQVGGNILLGMPFGFLAPLIWRKINTFLPTLIAGFLFSFSIEMSQFLFSLLLGYTYRVTDIDDIILNCTGVALGYLCFKLFTHFKNVRTNKMNRLI